MKKILAIAVCFLLFTSCATTYKGILIDARDYANTQAQDTIAHRFATFYAMKANLPVGLKTKSGKLFYLICKPEDLCKYAEKQVRIKGTKSKLNKRLLLPEEIQVKENNNWKNILYNIKSNQNE